MGESATTSNLELQSFENSSDQDSFAYQETMGTMDRNYEFFVTTNEPPHQPEGTERGLIRRLVMRNFFETKGAGTQSNNTSEGNSKSTVMAKKQLKSRFRLSKAGQEEKDAKGKGRESKEDSTTAVDTKKRRPKAPRTLSATTNTSNDTQRTNSLEASPNQQSDQVTKERLSRTPVPPNPSTHPFDPFSVLPVPSSPDLSLLFKIYKPTTSLNSLATNPGFTWWSFISRDAGLLHATLATWALYGMVFSGIAGLEVVKLRHRDGAIREIGGKLSGREGGVSDELIGTVVVMAGFESLLGAYDSAHLHVAALKRMIYARGGIEAFKHNDGLLRSILWLDFHTSTAFHTLPSFPYIAFTPTTTPSTAGLPDELLELAALTSPTSPLQLSLDAVPCFNIFYLLHRLGLAVSAHWLPRTNRVMLSNLLYEVEFAILSIPDHSRDFLAFDSEASRAEPDPHADDEGELERRILNADAASLIEALMAACQIFVFAALRDVPRNARILAILLDRMRVALDRTGVRAVDVWRREGNANVLVWVYMLGCSVCVGEARGWWVRELVGSMRALEVHTRFDLEVVLKHVAWVEGYFNNVLGEVWEEVIEMRRNIVMERENSGIMGSVGTGGALGSGDGGTYGDGDAVTYEDGRWRAGGWYV